MEYTEQLKKIDDYKVGDEVMVLMETLKVNGTEWRRGKVVQMNHVAASRYNNAYNYPIVEVVRTYYRKLKNNYKGVIWVGEDFELYDKLNQEGFVQTCQIKKICIDTTINLVESK